MASSRTMPQPLSVIWISFFPPASTVILIRVAPASSAFSSISFTTDAGRSTTSPAAIWLATVSERTWMRPMGRNQLSVVSCQLSVVSCQLSVVSAQFGVSALGLRELIGLRFLGRARLQPCRDAADPKRALAPEVSDPNQLNQQTPLQFRRWKGD